MKIIAETPRLILREITTDDAENAYILNADLEVLEYTGDEPFSNITEARSFLEAYDHYDKYGFGRWAMIRKSDNAFLGWCGLKYTADVQEYDIGFRLSKQYWQQGYATEAAKVCLTLGFEKFQMPVIIGRAMKANIASIRVLQKIGLTYSKPFDFDGQEGVIYSLENPRIT